MVLTGRRLKQTVVSSASVSPRSGDGDVDTRLRDRPDLSHDKSGILDLGADIGWQLYYKVRSKCIDGVAYVWQTSVRDFKLWFPYLSLVTTIKTFVAGHR